MRQGRSGRDGPLLARHSMRRTGPDTAAFFLSWSTDGQGIADDAGPDFDDPQVVPSSHPHLVWLPRDCDDDYCESRRARCLARGNLHDGGAAFIEQPSTRARRTLSAADPVNWNLPTSRLGRDLDLTRACLDRRPGWRYVLIHNFIHDCRIGVFVAPNGGTSVWPALRGHLG